MKNILIFLFIVSYFNVNAQYYVDTTLSSDKNAFYFEKDIARIPLKIKRLEIVCIQQTENNCRVYENKMLFESLTNLQEIALCGVKFEKIPFNICCCSKIEELILNYNGLIGFPKELFCLKDLSLLQIYGNVIDSILSLSEFPRLNILSLVDNDLCYIPDDLCDLKIEYLDLSQNPSINNIHTFHVIEKMEQLKTLSLSGCGITALPSGFSQLKNLKTINLNFNKSIIQDSVFIVLSNMPSIDTLSMSNCKMKTISDEINSLRHLESLDLSDNKLKDITVLCSMTNLKKLNISGTSVRKIPPCIADLTSLSELNISFTKINKLPDEIEKLKNLKILHAIGTNISSEEFERISKKLPNCKIKTFKRTDEGVRL